MKIDDLIRRRIDENGVPSDKHHLWKVVDLVYSQALALEDLHVGQEYGIYIRLDNALQPYILTGIDVHHGTYTFKALTPGKEDLKATVVESVVKGNQGGYVRDGLEMSTIRKQKFTIDVVDDVRSITDTNTRIIGDFTKMVRSTPIAQKMFHYISDPKDPDWRLHFEKLVDPVNRPRRAQDRSGL